MTTDDAVTINGTRKAFKEMADGTLRVQIDIEPYHKANALKYLAEIDMPVVIVPVVPGRGNAQ